jgi:pimeloyl-ACP methyl ester carboxylesterase
MTARPEVHRKVSSVVCRCAAMVDFPPDMRPLVSCLFVLLVVPAFAAEPETIQELRRLLPKSEPWERWLENAKPTPPDFEKLPSVPYLPDPLRFANGKEVKKEDWLRRRRELLELFQYYVIGKFPPSPGNVRPASIVPREEAGAFIDEVLLEFGPEHNAKLNVEIIIPRGRGPFPVFLTQDNHRSWALVAVSRGYIGCVYAGADSRDDTGAWMSIWPEYDWTKLTRRAWAASRCIDYLHTLPVVDTNRIALTGHSRNGKLAIIGAAIDQRVNAIISSSSGAGGACSFRLFSETEFGEGIELITRNFPDWLHPRLRFFAGREHKLPVDMPELIASFAPRPCLISSALNDSVESIWAIEQTYYSARRAYELLDKPYGLNLLYRPGSHETRAADIERYLDWLDAVFGRRDFYFPDAAVYPTYERWEKLSGEVIDAKSFPSNSLEGLLLDREEKEIKSTEEWLKKREGIRDQMLWAMGEAPAFAETGLRKYGSEPQHAASMLGRGSVPNGLVKQSFSFGNYIAGDLYFPTNADRAGNKIPAVVWLHPISTAHGYMPGYRRGEPPHLALARTGVAVFAFDQIGHGARLPEVQNFYERFPKWSLFGKTVEDTLAAVEALLKVSFINPKKIFLLGYSSGAMVALHAGALDDRVAGVISVAGFTPMRLDTLNKGTGGIARWSRWYPMLPRLGAFVGQESRVPYDYHEVLAMIAPRPVVVFAPKLDYRATLGDVKICVEEARKVFEMHAVKENLKLVELNDYNRFSPESQIIVYGELSKLARKPPAKQEK